MGMVQVQGARVQEAGEMDGMILDGHEDELKVGRNLYAATKRAARMADASIYGCRHSARPECDHWIDSIPAVGAQVPWRRGFLATQTADDT